MNKSIVITGTTSGIGAAAVRTFSRAGYRVFAGYRGDAAPKEFAAMQNVTAVHLDVTDRAVPRHSVIAHYATIGRTYGSSTFFPTADKIAQRLVAVVDRAKPRFRYNLALDACVTERFLSRWLPWSLQARMNRRMFRLDAVRRGSTRGTPYRLIKPLRIRPSEIRDY